jgi:organic hydroperoxide reductase OsmC/OhrA
VVGGGKRALPGNIRAQLELSDLAVRVSLPTAESELRALVDDATERCPAYPAIRGNVAMQVTAQFDAV